MVRLLTRLGQLTPAERGLLAESVVMLAAAAFMIALLPFRRIASLARSPVSNPLGQAEQERLIASVRWAVAAAAKRVPWRAKCLEQGFAAQWMLRRRFVPAVVHYGIAKSDEGLLAHAWVRAGSFDVIGCENLGDFAEVAQFPPRPA
jgi:hypothetical protein